MTRGLLQAVKYQNLCLTASALWLYTALSENLKGCGPVMGNGSALMGTSHAEIQVGLVAVRPRSGATSLISQSPWKSPQ